MLFPIYFDGDLTVNEVALIFTQAGYHVRNDSAGRMVASRVPRFLRKDEPQSNVVRLPGRARKVGK